ncbi:hypothetical protein SLE2022_199710 [Rubroshorea leprosula]
MSRCLPFPPPGYARNGVTGEALLQLIKVRREEAKAERKRKKKERRRKRMEELEEGEILQKKHKRSKKSQIELETLAMGRSCVIEDLRQPMFVCPFDSYGNSQSTGWNNHSWYGYGCHSHGSTAWVDFHMVSSSIYSEGNLKHRESQFGEHWIPDPLQVADFEFEDQNWLFRRKQPNYMRETSNTRSFGSCHGNLTLYPHAKYFPHADIYAYPYAIPY